MKNLDETAIKIKIRPVIKTLIMMVTNKELGGFLDKRKLKEKG